MPFEFIAEGKNFTPDAFDEFYAHEKEVREKEGIKHAIWSMDFVDLYEVYEPLKGVTKLVYDYDWFDGAGRVEVDLPENATGVDVLKAVDYLLVNSKDHHHIFLEGIDIKDGVGYPYFGS